MEADYKGETKHVVLGCSFSILPMANLTTNPSYPGISEDYRKTFERLESLPCDVFISPHGQFFKLTEKMEAMKTSEKNVFIDPELYKQYVARGKEAYLKRLEEEKARG